METELIVMSPKLKRCQFLESRVKLRTMSAENFIEAHASGTLRKNKRLNMSWRAQYLHERVCYDFGASFELVPKSRVTFGDAYTEADCKPITEAGWFCERYLNILVFPGDYLEVKYLQVDYGDGKKREGIGFVVRQTSAAWLPKGHIVFAIVAEFNPTTGQFLAVDNPS